jgi:hypothetical protein
MDGPTASIIVALIGAIATIAVAFINRPKPDPIPEVQVQAHVQPSELQTQPNPTSRTVPKSYIRRGFTFALILHVLGVFNQNAFSQCGSGFAGTIPYPSPGATCLIDGYRSFNPTWAVEVNYYMDLGFLPESMQFFSISGRAGWYGPDGYENNPLPGTQTAVELNSEPIPLTFDASKAMWGTKYSPFVDVWGRLPLLAKQVRPPRGNAPPFEQTSPQERRSALPIGCAKRLHVQRRLWGRSLPS